MIRSTTTASSHQIGAFSLDKGPIWNCNSASMTLLPAPGSTARRQINNFLFKLNWLYKKAEFLRLSWTSWWQPNLASVSLFLAMQDRRNTIVSLSVWLDVPWTMLMSQMTWTELPGVVGCWNSGKSRRTWSKSGTVILKPEHWAESSGTGISYSVDIFHFWTNKIIKIKSNHFCKHDLNQNLNQNRNLQKTGFKSRFKLYPKSQIKITQLNANTISNEFSIEVSIPTICLKACFFW